MKFFTLQLSLLLILASQLSADEEIFSGPQVGEKMPTFEVQGVLEQEGKKMDFIKQAEGKPTLLIFMHKATRPSIAVNRMLMDYAKSREKDHLQRATVWLTADVTESKAFLKRAQHALPKDSPVGISADGQEGPGSYGLNRNVTLTILVAKDNKVVANFALVQPSVQADVPKVVEAIVKVIGGKVPTLEELSGNRKGSRENPNNPNNPQAMKQDPNLRSYLAPVINKQATKEEVDEAVKKAEAYFDKNPETKKQVGVIANRIVSSGKLGNYGTTHAQEAIKNWAKKYASVKGDVPKEKDPTSEDTQDKSSEQKKPEKGK